MQLSNDGQSAQNIRKLPTRGGFHGDSLEKERMDYHTLGMVGALCRVLCTSHLARVLDSVHSNLLLYDTFFDSAA